VRALITADVGNAWQRLPPDLGVRFCPATVAGLNEALDEQIEILVTDALPSDIARATGLRWVQLLSSGTNQLIGHPLAERPILASSAAGICAVHIAEFVVARVLYHAKEFRAFEHLQQHHAWADRIALARPSLRGQCAVLVGYGGVGRETARLLSALGMRIIAVAREATRRPYEGYMPYEGIGDPDALIPERIVATDELHDVLPEADVVVLSVSLNRSTQRLIDAAALARMRPSAILVNIARGSVVDTAALLAALDRGQLAHAYLDVFDEEPLPATSNLWAHPGIAVTSHMAGVMPDAALRLEELFLANLARFRRGERLINQIDPAALSRG
jgi:D-2-hydroxyacid dehydrogenase (NADP+)